MIQVIQKADGKCRNKDKAEPFAKHIQSRFLLNLGLDQLVQLNSNDYENTPPLHTPEEISE